MPSNLLEKNQRPLAAHMSAAPLPEVSRPLRANAGGVVYADGSVMRPIDRASENERELKPLVYGDSKPLDDAAREALLHPPLDPFYAQLAADRAAGKPTVLDGTTATATILLEGASVDSRRRGDGIARVDEPNAPAKRSRGFTVGVASGKGRYRK